MKSLLILALVGLLALLPLNVGASWYNPTPEELVSWSGCTAAVVTSDQHSALESVYDSEGHVIYYGTDGSVPEEYARMVLLHEVGHCIQNQSSPQGTFQFDYSNDPQKFELDADRYSADLACRQGEPGVRLQNDLLDWVRDTYNYNGDAGHGTLDQRKAAGASAQACRKDIQS